MLLCRALLLPWPFHYLSSSFCSFFLSSHFFCVPSCCPCPGFLPFLRYISTEAPHPCLTGSALPQGWSCCGATWSCVWDKATPGLFPWWPPQRPPCYQSLTPVHRTQSSVNHLELVTRGSHLEIGRAVNSKAWRKEQLHLWLWHCSSS